MSIMQMMLGASGGGGLSVGDVFSIDLWTGNETNRSITNGLDLGGEGGLVWIKSRGNSRAHRLYDTEREATYEIYADDTSAEAENTGGLTAFNADGFTIGTSNQVNSDEEDFVGWSFRSAPGFFDVVEYEGDGVDGRTVAHSLGSIPGMIIVRHYDAREENMVYHRSVGNTEALELNSTSQPQFDGSPDIAWDDTSPTDSVFTVGSHDRVNRDGYNYIAYVFAHDDQSFGGESIIKCGGYTGDGDEPGATITLGWEPQWLIVKRTDSNEYWPIYDAARGGTSNKQYLIADNNGAEADNANFQINFTSTGFQPQTDDGSFNEDGGTYVYMAIRKED